MTKNLSITLTEIVTVARDAAAKIEHAATQNNHTPEKISPLKKLSEKIKVAADRAENNDLEAVRIICDMLGLERLLAVYDAERAEQIAQAKPPERAEPKFFESQLEQVRATWPLLLLPVLAFIAFFFTLRNPSFIGIGLFLFSNIVMVFNVILARIFIRDNLVDEDWGWFITAVAIFVLALIGIIYIESVENGSSMLVVTKEAMTLFWAPIASAMILIPLMKVKKKHNPQT